MNILFVIDRIELKYFEFNNLVTNFWMIREFLLSNKRVFITTIDNLSLVSGVAYANCYETYEKDGNIFYELVGDETVRGLHFPFSYAYIFEDDITDHAVPVIAFQGRRIHVHDGRAGDVPECYSGDGIARGRTVFAVEYHFHMEELPFLDSFHPDVFVKYVSDMVHVAAADGHASLIFRIVLIMLQYVYVPESDIFDDAALPVSRIAVYAHVHWVRYVSP